MMVWNGCSHVGPYPGLTNLEFRRVYLYFREDTFGSFSVEKTVGVNPGEKAPAYLCRPCRSPGKVSLARLPKTAISLYSAISPKVAIIYRRFRRYSTYPSILEDTKGCMGRPESSTPEFDKRQYFETFHLVF